jgi:homoserine dehydrogenase
MTTFDLVLVGFGHVARRFVALLEEERPALAREQIAVRIVGVVTRRHGMVMAVRGLDAVALADRVARGGRIGTSRDERPAVEFIESTAAANGTAAEGRLIVVETTTLDIASGQPAIDHIRAALACGAHVITANKGPVAFAYHALAEAAARTARRFLFEGAVMDGVPVFNLVRETLPGVGIIGFRGVVNSTTNFILTAMEQGQPYAEALAEMQGMGIAESDASLDVEGWDAAAKTAALANVLLDAHLTPHDVERVGISAGLRSAAMEARSAGRRLKLVARAGRDEGRIAARVAPEELPEDDLLAGLEGQQNALVLHTELLGEIAVVQRGSGLTQTAYALFSDLITIGRDLNRSQTAERARR